MTANRQDRHRYNRGRGGRRNWLRTLITVLAVIFSIWGAWGLLFLVSPSLFVKSVSWLPTDFQNSMAGDYLISGGMNLYIRQLSLYIK